MQNVIKRLTALILSMAMALSLLCGSAWAEELDLGDTGGEPAAESSAEILDESSQEAPDEVAEPEPEEEAATDGDETTMTDSDSDSNPDSENDAAVEDVPEANDGTELENIPTEDESSQDESTEDGPSEDVLPEDELTEDELLEDELLEDELLEDEVSEVFFNITETDSLSLEYDDRYSFTADYPGYAILNIETTSVTSYQVSGGAVTGQLDTAVLTQKEGSNTDVIASGIGTAQVLLVSSDQLEAAQQLLNSEEAADSDSDSNPDPDPDPDSDSDSNPDPDPDPDSDSDSNPDPIPAVLVEVEVSPAVLTIMLLTGQSNMDGNCSAASGYHPEDSVLCEEGQVYSTFAPSSAGPAVNYTGLSDFKACTTANVEQFVAGSLTGNTALDGSEMVYPLNALTQAGKGKTGPDSGIAYEWNRLTGEKVWAVNTAWGGSSVSSWEENATYYTRAQAVYNAMMKTTSAEITAGHYVKGRRLLFWLQGEGDCKNSMETSVYREKFLSMYNGMKKAYALDAAGIILVRSSLSHLTEEDLTMRGPRIAQYSMGNSAALSDIYLVSNVNEQWVTDAGVKNYFQSAYPQGKLTYPLRSNTTITGLPTTVKQVHADIHYTQVGHNENGITAARTMYAVLNGSGASATTVYWRDENGSTLNSTLTCNLGQTVTLVPQVEPLSAAKKVTYTVEGDCVVYDVENCTFTAIAPGTAVIQAVNAQNTVVSSINITVDSLLQPTVNVSNGTSGVVVQWSDTGADQYKVYRKTSKGNWTTIEESISGNTFSYTDTEVESGTEYSYAVCGYYGSIDQWSDFAGATIKTIRYLSTVTPTVSNTSTGVAVKWSAVTGASGYYVYRKTETTSWVEIADITSGSTVSYMDTKAVSGTNYGYTVRAYNGSDMSGCVGRALVRLTQPAVTLANASNGVTVSWNQIAGATGYYVYRKTSTTSWVKIATISSGSTVSYTDTKAVSGKNYGYTVRAYNGNTMSSYVGRALVYLAQPSATLANASNGMKVSWNRISGASGYYVYRKTATTSWVKIATISSGSTVTYTDTTAVSGTNYGYTVRAYNSSTMSSYAGRALVRLAQPTATLANASNGVKVSWNKITGASGYYVYRKTSTTSWVKIATVTSGSTVIYTDTTAVSGTNYGYTVRAYNGSSMSSYAGRALVYLAQPSATLANASNGMKVSWNKITGANGYYVYRKTSTTSWVKIATISSGSTVSYTDTKAVSGKNYGYTVRAYNGNTMSSYAGRAMVRLARPAVTLAKNTKGVKVSWNKIAGASGYYVYRKTATTSWVKIATITSGSTISYMDTTAKTSTTYYYTVRAYNGSSMSSYVTNKYIKL